MESLTEGERQAGKKIRQAGAAPGPGCPPPFEKTVGRCRHCSSAPAQRRAWPSVTPPASGARRPVALALCSSATDARGRAEGAALRFWDT